MKTLRLRGRWPLLAFVLLLAAGAAALLSGLGPRLWHRVFHHSLRLVVVADGLDTPWAMAFLPDGRLIVTERPGRMRVLDAQGRPGPPLLGLPDVVAQGEGGLMDVALAPDFAVSRRLCWSYSAAAPEGGSGTAVACGRLGEGRLEQVRVIFRQPGTARTLHYGSRLLFAPDGHLFVALGDRWRRDDAQDPASTHGKILRLDMEGGVPADNPFAGRPGAAAAVWSLGHRNVQGLAFHPETGALWASEHGPLGGDEINLIRPGLNYGWPVATHGCEYDGCALIGQGPSAPGMVPPLAWFGPRSVPLTGMAFLTSDRYPAWRGELFVGTLLGQALMRLRLDGERVLAREPMWLGRYKRVRDVKQGPDGWLYVAVELPRGAILRLER